jgi:hypothetical protein
MISKNLPSTNGQEKILSQKLVCLPIFLISPQFRTHFPSSCTQGYWVQRAQTVGGKLVAAVHNRIHPLSSERISERERRFLRASYALWLCESEAFKVLTQKAQNWLWSPLAFRHTCTLINNRTKFSFRAKHWNHPNSKGKFRWFGNYQY